MAELPSGNLILVFFLYGLAFFSMGIATLQVARRNSSLVLGRAMRFLTAFGLLHALVEWLDMFDLIHKRGLDLLHFPPILWIRLGLLIVSLYSLNQFGLKLLVADSQNWRWVRFISTGLFLTWAAGLTMAVLFDWQESEEQLLIHGDAWARYLLHLPGSIFSTLGMIKQARFLEANNFKRPARDARLAALGFAFILIFGSLIVPHLNFFPATIVNYDSFADSFGIPVQIFRAISATFTAIFVVSVLQVFEDEYHQQLKRAHQQRESLSALVLSAQEDERKRIARELHDDTAQSLASLLLHLKLLEKSSDLDNMPQKLEQIIGLTDRTMDGVRRLALQLRPQDLDDLGLVPALERLTQEMTEISGVAIHVETDNMGGRLPDKLEMVIYRIIQEALSNTIKHANAQSANVTIRRFPDFIDVKIIDDGCGFQHQNGTVSDKRGLGLFGMSERAILINGQLQVESKPGAGTAVHLQAPISEVS